MITNVNPALLAFLNSRPSQMQIADCLTFSLQNGATYRWTGWDVPVTISNPTPDESGTLTWNPGPPEFSRSSTSIKLGTESSEHQVEMLTTTGVMLNGTSLLQMVMDGAFNLAIYSLDRAIARPGGSWLGTVNRFYGEVTDIQNIGRTGARITVKSMTHRLDTDWPRNTIQPGCLHVLYSTGCGLSKSAWAVPGTVASGSTTNKVLAAGTAKADGYFANGRLSFTTGKLAGLTVMVRRYEDGIFYPLTPLLTAPGEGDVFTAYPGCDKTLSTCESTFANTANFKGFPYVPDPEASY